jgi:hypothetical protein
MNSPRTITRESLYELVWSKPCRAVAKELGISDVAVGKICRKLEVPKPERGFWAKKAYGKAVKIIPLKSPVDAPATATVEGGRTSAPREKIVRIEETKRVIVENELTEPDRLVVSTRRALERVDRGTGGILSSGFQDRFLSLKVSKTQLDRSLRILDTLIKTFKERDIRTTAEDPPERHNSAFVVGKETISFSLRELAKRIKNNGTEQFGASKWDNFAYKPSGTLVLRLEGDLPENLQKKWADGKTQNVEDVLGEIVATVIAIAEAMPDHRQKRAEEEKRREEERKQRELYWREQERLRFQESMRRAKEEARRKKLEDEANNWHRVTVLRSYIARREEFLYRIQGTNEEKPQISDWINWAKNYADSLDPSNRTLQDLGWEKLPA